MLRTLEQILRMVAEQKKISNKEKWVDEKLAHCEVRSDYFSWVHLKANKNMWFGVRDTQFNCQPFILYREMMNNDSSPTKEFEIYTFTDLQDEKFVELLKEAYCECFDSVRDLLVFFEDTVINFNIKTETGYASLGSYNEIVATTDFLITDLYCLTLRGSSIKMYARDKAVIGMKIIDLRSYFKEEEGKDYMTSEDVILTRNGQQLPLQLVAKGQSQWDVRFP